MVYIPVDWRESVKKECKRRRYSNKTSKTYIFCIERFLNFCGKSLDKISKKDVREFLEHLSEKGRTGNTMNVYHMAIRFLFEEVLDKRIWIDISYSKVPEKIQKFLTKEEMIKLIDAIKNQKHQLMICLMYSAGLRVSELINLKVCDLILDKGYGFVRNGKGGKDRVIIIAKNLILPLKKIIENQKLSNDDFLFRSNRNEKYSARSIQQIVKKAVIKAGLNPKEIHCHTLRHSFATHLIENNYSISDVQASLGHKSPKTSMIYVHGNGKMIGIRSPLETL